jgi:plasmid stabilization system protein ParE
VQVRFRSEAVEDVEVARAWYNEQRDDLGNDFVVALESAIRLVVEFPEAFPEIAARHRRALLHRFPYALYYRVEGDVVEVLACLHESRSPGIWRSRD